MNSRLPDSLLPDWEHLWAAAQAATRAGDGDPRYVFEPIGLMLEPPGPTRPWDYDATPPGSVTFAATGGDGVHFSGLDTDNGVIVVMTVPMHAARPNIVVGTTIREFLGLGCRHGYFGLEQLAYAYNATAAELEDAPTWPDENRDRCLSLLRDRLELSPWSNPRGRLDELQPLLPSA